MTSLRLLSGTVALVLLGVTITDAAAQGLERRVASAGNGLVQFNYPARDGVCGNGKTFINIGGNSWHGTINDATRREACEPGPVRVVMNLAGGQVVSIETFVGPLQTEAGANDLGAVSPGDASDYLLGLAARGEGKPSRDAIFPATLAQGAQPADRLLAIANDRARPRETRRQAIAYAGREVERGNAPAQRVTSDLVRIATDASDNSAVRSRAVQTLAGLDRGEGIPALIELSRSASDSWLASQAMRSLASSGDPRARDYLRTALRGGRLHDDVAATAIRGMGGNYATSSDAAFLREIYASLQGQKAKTAVFNALGEIGGTENRTWLLARVRDSNENADDRRRALSAARKAGADINDLVSLYDAVGDQSMKASLISLYGGSTETAATDKLISIARTETDRTLRRRSISRLSKSDDPRVKQVLAEIVER
ncbi:MAG TPA: HEAT repeat domain-containing protein [Gemmatimonadaceae bacterium]|nr:HEAT repeat domain-containing protein [Gemmatimonadaceae bacterium]